MYELEIIETQDTRACMVDDRTCTDCKTLKGAEEFSINSSYRLHKGTNEYRKQVKRGSVCKACKHIRTKKWVEANRERNNTYQRKYQRQLRRQREASIMINVPENIS